MQEKLDSDDIAPGKISLEPLLQKRVTLRRIRWEKACAIQIGFVFGRVPVQCSAWPETCGMRLFACRHIHSFTLPSLIGLQGCPTYIIRHGDRQDNVWHGKTYVPKRYKCHAFVPPPVLCCYSFKCFFNDTSTTIDYREVQRRLFLSFNVAFR